MRLLRSVARWFPFVFPGAPLVRMTGAVISGSDVILAHGRLRGLHLLVQSARRFPAENPDPADLRGLAGEPVCACLPRQRTMVRYFRIPADSDAEIEAMVPHLLSSELPLSLEHFSWVWRSVAVQDDGHRLIAVHVARNDSLEDFLAPLARVGLDLVGLVPEGWVWAHAAGQVRQEQGETDDPSARSIVVRGESGPYLVVERAGEFLFDSVLDSSQLGSPDSGVQDWEGPGFAEVRGQFQELFGFAPPEPQIWPDALTDVTSSEAIPFFCASVAASGVENRRLLIPPQIVKRGRRRVLLRTLAGLGRIAVLAALVWLVLGVNEDRRTRRSLETMNQQLLEERQKIIELEVELKAVMENSRERAGSAQVLRAVASLRRSIKSPIYLENMEYVKDRGITLRGAAPSSADVLEMTETLSGDPLWRGLRVLQLRSEQFNGADRVHFVVENNLN